MLKYVRNITDIDDKIIEASQKKKKLYYLKLTNEITKIFHENCKSLILFKTNCRT